VALVPVEFAEAGLAEEGRHAERDHVAELCERLERGGEGGEPEELGEGDEEDEGCEDQAREAREQRLEVEGGAVRVVRGAAVPRMAHALPIAAW